MTSAEADYYAQVLEIHRKGSEQKGEIDTEYYEQTRKHLENAIELEQLKRGEFYDNDTELRLKHAEDTFNIEMDSLRQLLEQKKITQEEYNEEAEIAEENHQQNQNEIRKEAFLNALALNGEFVENMKEIQQMYTGFTQLMNAQIKDDYLLGLSNMMSGLKSFAREGSNTWKVMASFQATLNTLLAITKALTEGNSLYEKIIGVAFATVTGMMALVKINSTPKPAYEQGTLYAEKTTLAITDEAGPELHYDKNWKLKDKGSSGGARVKNVVQGDKILPADLSKLIMKLHLPVNSQNHPESLDYDKLASKIAEKTVTANEKQKKEFFLFDSVSGEVIRVESKNGMRTVFRKENPKPTGQKLR